MKPFTLKEAADACGGKLVNCDENAGSLLIENISIDSRKTGCGYLYIPIKGERFDGHDFIKPAFENGTVCSLSEKADFDAPAGSPVILVESTRQAIRDIAEYYRSLFKNLTVIGISGSSGKTSTKEMIYAVLSEHFNVLKTEGNLNNEIGVPQTLFRIEEEHDIAVVEMGINHFGEMTRLAKMVRPDIAVITNIGTAHLEFLESRDGILKAKTEMFQYLNPNGIAVLNGDDDKLSTVKAVKTLFFGLNSESYCHADKIKQRSTEGTEFDIICENTSLKAFVPALGNHMVMNSLCAFTIGKYLGMPVEKIIKGINNFKTIDGRFNVIKTGSLTLINDCYNANPDSMAASLRVVSNLKGRRTAVLADMRELGDNSAELHEKTGFLAASSCDVLVCIGDDAKHIMEGAKKAKPHFEAYYFENNKDAVNKLPAILKKDDTVLIKGSHSMNLSEITDFLKSLNF